MRKSDAFITAAFGTADSDEYDKSIKKIHNELYQEMNVPGYIVITGTKAREALRAQGKQVLSMEEAFQKLKEEGHKRILVVAMYFSPGKEYDGLTKICRENIVSFEEIDITVPLLEMSTVMASYVDGLFPMHPGIDIILLYHETHNSKTQPINRLKEALKEIGRNDIRFAGVHETEGPLSGIIPRGSRKIFASLLMFCSGHHAESFFEELRDICNNYDIEYVADETGMGSRDSFCRIFIDADITAVRNI